MGKLKLEFRNTERYAPILSVKGKPTTLKYDRYGNGSCEVEKSECVRVELKKVFEESAKSWFWFDLLYFIISFFGIFDVRRGKSCRGANVSINFYPSDMDKTDEAIIRADTFKQGGEAVTVESTCPYEILENTFYSDEVSKKRIKLSKVLRISFWVVMLIVCVAIVVKTLI